jgi:hypothetical protein
MKSLLYHAFGVKGFRYLRTRYEGGEISLSWNRRRNLKCPPGRSCGGTGIAGARCARVSESLCLGHNLREGKMTKEKKETKCDDLIDALLEKHGISPEAVLGENGLIAQLKKRVVERALAGELTHHLGYAKGEAPEEGR